MLLQTGLTPGVTSSGLEATMQARVPRCPKCADGGKVEFREVPNGAHSVFKPVPKNEPVTIPIFQCECGWTMIVPQSKKKAESAQ